MNSISLVFILNLQHVQLFAALKMSIENKRKNKTVTFIMVIFILSILNKEIISSKLTDTALYCFINIESKVSYSAENCTLQLNLIKKKKIIVIF